jgi:hypothetical protein
MNDLYECSTWRLTIAYYKVFYKPFSTNDRGVRQANQVIEAIIASHVLRENIF